jgi:hypothetical protein
MTVNKEARDVPAAGPKEALARNRFDSILETIGRTPLVRLKVRLIGVHSPIATDEQQLQPGISSSRRTRRLQNGAAGSSTEGEARPLDPLVLVHSLLGGLQQLVNAYRK